MCAQSGVRTAISKYIPIYEWTRETFKFIAGRKNWATKIRGELVIRMISCFPFYINDYRKLGGIVCGRNCVIYLDALHWPVQRISRGQILIWPPYMWSRSRLIIYNPGWYVKKKKKSYLKHETGASKRGPVIVQIEHFDPEHAYRLFGWMSVINSCHR